MAGNIIFAGDSFTWGEGLELYHESDTARKERLRKNNWVLLRNRVTPEMTQFRLDNRFATRVSNELGLDLRIRPKNGGSNNEIIDFIENSIDTDTKYIVWQFSLLQRSSIHLNKKCECKYCKNLVNIEKRNGTWNWINYATDRLGLTDEEFIYKEYNRLWNENFQYIKERIKQWKIPVDIISSWDELDYPFFEKHLSNNLLQLEVRPNQFMTNYAKWINVMSGDRYNTMINEDFPESCNGHPNLYHHKLLTGNILRWVNKMNEPKHII